MKQKIKTVKKVIKGLKKASKSHAKQARALQGVVKNLFQTSEIIHEKYMEALIRS